ncbi:MAG TPA: peptidoglycan editing factor PgeF [Granulicella sp.]
MQFVRIPAWEGLNWLRHGFSTRDGGVSEVYGGRSLNLGWTKEDDPAHVAENRRLFAEAVGGDGSALVTVRQIHSAESHGVREGDGPLATEEGRAVLEGDGLMTQAPGRLLGIQTADCVPVMVVDPARRAVAVFHAGWRGTVAAIVEAGVAQMQEEFGSRPEDLLAAVGPSIGPCCYAVGDEVRTAFGERFAYADQLFDERRLNLWEANRRQLVEAGIGEDRITVVGECTGCALNAAGERRYFSHRIDRGVAGRMMSVVGIAPE